MAWIKIEKGCKMPAEGQDILYVVSGKDYKTPVVVRGERNHITNEGWWWCDHDGISSEVGNDGQFSFVTHWRPMILPPKAAIRTKSTKLKAR